MDQWSSTLAAPTSETHPRKYVENILKSYQRMFGEVYRKARTPLIPLDQPDLDTTEFCGEEEVKHFQTLIGQL